MGNCWSGRQKLLRQTIPTYPSSSAARRRHHLLGHWPAAGAALLWSSRRPARGGVADGRCRIRSRNRFGVSDWRRER